MANAYTKIVSKIVHSVQEMFNMSFDSDFNQNTVEMLGFDGQALQRLLGDALAVKVTESGTTTYIGIAAPGTSQATAKWQCKKIDESSGIVITWADGDSNFDNIATDLTSLSYV